MYQLFFNVITSSYEYFAVEKRDFESRFSARLFWGLKEWADLTVFSATYVHATFAVQTLTKVPPRLKRS